MPSSDPPLAHVAVFGASSPVAHFLAYRLTHAGIGVHRIGRGQRPGEPVHRFDPELKRFDPPIHSADALVCCAPLPVVDTAIEAAVSLNARRIVAFGSTGRFTKMASSSPVEQEFVRQQADAEDRFEQQSRRAGIEWTLFRPTMIYGSGADLNVAVVGRFIRRFRCFPLPRGANGLRQPVHADDLAAACLGALSTERTFNRAYDLGGGERLPYERMVARIFEGLKLRPAIIRLPGPAYRMMANAMSRLPGYRFVRAEMVTRLFTDLVADHATAQSDFGYSPRRFHPAFQDILGPF